MVPLKIDFQDGFEDDLIILKVNGREIFRKDRVSTNPAVSHACSLEIDLPEQMVEIEVILPIKDISGAVQLDVSLPVYLGVSILDNKIHFAKSDTPFFYF